MGFKVKVVSLVWSTYMYSNHVTAIVQKWVPYSQRYLFNAIPDTNHNANPTNPNTRYRCE